VTKRLFAVIALALLSTPVIRAGALENAGPQPGRVAPPITWTDDSGRVRKLSDFGGYPLILLPIYTRCPMACIQNVAQLKKTLAESDATPTEFRVLLFSFDSTDTISILAEYRQRESVPLGWFVGTADQSSIDALLESIGFQYGKTGSDFAHPNIVVFLDPKLRIAKWIYGTGYTGRDIDDALKIALGQSDWIGQHSDFVYTILLFAASVLCVALFHNLRQRRIHRNDVHWRNQAPLCKPLVPK
jgi:cytochrome oxidase Cu insertion factor (SCO1/SenC/PrrC family)